MEIYQLNEYQEDMLTSASGGQKIICVVADQEIDGDHYQVFSDNMKLREDLVREGLLVEIDISEDEFVIAMEKKYGRKYRMFMLTDMAKSMFSPVLVKGDKEGTFRNVSKTVH